MGIVKILNGAVITAGCIAALVTILSVPAAQRYMSPAAAHNELQYDRRNDPGKYAAFPVPLADAFGVPIRPARENIVVIAGSCSSCSLNAIDPRKTVPRQGQSYIFAYQMTRKDLPSWAHHLPEMVRVVADDDASLSRRANAIWKPRYVRLNAGYRVIDLSDNFGGIPNYVHLRPN
jgi:hypothetical protein